MPSSAHPSDDAPIRGSARLILTAGPLATALEECRRRRVPAVVAPVEAAAAYPARFADGAANGDLALELREPAELAAGQFACVSFTYAGRSWLFVARVRDHLAGDGTCAARLVVAGPTHAVGSDLRRAVRLAVPPASGLVVRAMSRHTPTLAPQAIDISLGGMGVEFPEGGDPDLELGSPLDVELCLGGARVVVKAIVRRRSGRSYGLSFPEHGDRQATTPAEPFQRILDALERSWFAVLRKS